MSKPIKPNLVHTMDAEKIRFVTEMYGTSQMGHDCFRFNYKRQSWLERVLIRLRRVIRKVVRWWA